MTTTEGATRNLGKLVEGGLEEAQKRIQGLEAEAQKRLKGLEAEAGKVVNILKVRGQESRKELNQLLAHPKVKELSRKVDEAGTGLRKRMGVLQTRVVETVGVASQAQVRQIHKEVTKLSKKLDEMVGSAAAAVANGSAQVTGKKGSAKASAQRV